MPAHSRVLLAGVLAGFAAGPALAQNISNEAWIGQLGSGNTLEIVQEGRSNSADADNVFLLLSQQGVGNALVLMQSGYSNKVGTLFGDEIDYARGVWQTGDINSIDIVQSNTQDGGSNAIGAVQQQSTANIVGLGANLLSVVQNADAGRDGTANQFIGRLVQGNGSGSGASNLADVVQSGGGTGAGNILANLYQVGSGNTFALTQTGQSNQTGETIRLGGAWQIGAGNQAFMVQDGQGNLAEYVKQYGQSNVVRLRLSGEGNAVASIDQNSEGLGEEGNRLAIVVSGEGNGGTGTGAVGEFLTLSALKQPGVLQGVFRQFGVDNDASLTITGGAESRYGLTQDGDGNRADVTISSNIATQLAMRNETAIHQQGSLNIARHDIAGDDNAAVIVQEGDRNTISVNQAGSGNVASVKIGGDDNNSPGALFGPALDIAGAALGELVQQGAGNRASLIATGSFNGTAIQQTGSNHQIEATMAGDANALSVVQQTSLNSALAVQNGTGNSLGIAQY